MRAPAALVLVLVVACDRNPRAGGVPSAKPSAAPRAQGSAPRVAPGGGRAPVSCTPDPAYPGMWQLPEASAAVELELRPGERSILALADSGNHGEAMIWPIQGGPTRAVRLELDPLASDDIEGAAWAGGHLYTLTSSGAVRRYTPSPNGDLVRDRSAYALGPPPQACDDLRAVNCGRNYEGLCLRPATTTARCAGYAASKAKGTLYCVVYRGDALAIDTIKPPITLGVPPNALSDCAFGAAGGPAEDVLLVTTNIYGGSTTYVVDEATSALAVVDVAGLPNNEAVAVDRDGALYQFMDGDMRVSPTYRASCHGWSLPPLPGP